MKLKTIAFDADDTLWMNETIYTTTHGRFVAILEKYEEPDVLQKRLYETEIKNLNLFGYGVKGFTLSMIETAVELTKGQITGDEVHQIVALGKDMLTHPVELLPHVEQTLKLLQESYNLMIITKGDLFDQETKIARSGLADYFGGVEILSEKNTATYQRLLQRNNIEVSDFLMVGNSLKSDILPIGELGASAVHIPFHTTWGHEMVSPENMLHVQYEVLQHIGELPDRLPYIFPSRQMEGMMADL
ncbi:HAD family hydrolase [Pontibacter qinzhouensis]|uniref:HAD family hydrolase n=1 Tax=Pontibacter qinzhouensis TaxID=2603253 RepID=A0A5C8JHN7_9BACT|nr:HAD family hydrolase [Pontibacter qinzhouensis]TXK38015.1 HAD family hydrolase [Pontibacter qinzhouensis]